MHSLSFRPCYLPKLHHISSAPPSESNALEPQQTQEDLEKRLTGLILGIKSSQTTSLLQSYLAIAMKPMLPGEEQILKFNIYHWTTWFQEIAKLKLKCISTSDKELLEIIYQKFLANIGSLLRPGENAIIVHSLSVLKQIAEPSERLIEYLANCCIRNLNAYSDKEIVILFKGAGTFSDHQKEALFDEFSEVFKNSSRFKEAYFHLQVTTLHAFSRLHSRRFEWITLFDAAESSYYRGIDRLDIKDILVFLDSLSNFSYKDCVLRILKDIELYLYNKISTNDFESTEMKCQIIARASLSFARGRYLPKKLIPCIELLLEDTTVKIWDKMTYFDALGRLGYNEILPQFKQFITVDLMQDDLSKNIPVWQTIYAQDLIRLLRTVSCLYSKDQKLPSQVVKIVARVHDLQKFLNLYEKMAFGEILIALGFNDIAKNYPVEKILPGSIVNGFKNKITDDIAKLALFKSKIKSVKIEKEYYIRGRPVDLVLFVATLKKPIACQFNIRTLNFCCNDQTRSIGKNLFRNKFLTNSGFTVCLLDQKTDGPNYTLDRA